MNLKSEAMSLAFFSARTSSALSIGLLLIEFADALRNFLTLSLTLTLSRWEREQSLHTVW